MKFSSQYLTRNRTARDTTTKFHCWWWLAMAGNGWQ